MNNGTDATPATPGIPGGREELQKFANGWLVEVSFGVYDREDLPRLADKLVAEIDPLLAAARLEAYDNGFRQGFDSVGSYGPEAILDAGKRGRIQGARELAEKLRRHAEIPNNLMDMETGKTKALYASAIDDELREMEGGNE